MHDLFQGCKKAAAVDSAKCQWPIKPDLPNLWVPTVEALRCAPQHGQAFSWGRKTTLRPPRPKLDTHFCNAPRPRIPLTNGFGTGPKWRPYSLSRSWKFWMSRHLMNWWRIAHHRGPVRCLHHPCQPCRNLGFLRLTMRRKPCVMCRADDPFQSVFKDANVNIFANIAIIFSYVQYYLADRKRPRTGGENAEEQHSHKYSWWESSPASAFLSSSPHQGFLKGGNRGE